MEAYKLHPLVLINVSDHHTRVAAQLPPGAAPPRVTGCLLGHRTGAREIEICTSFEVPHAPDATGAVSFDAPALAAQQARYKQVFPAFDVVGWYATAAAEARPDADHLRLHRSLAHLDENPAFALFTPGASSGSSAAAAKEPTTSTTTKTTASTLPITLYESVVRATETRFEPVEYTLATSEAERVAVDDAARSASLGRGAPGREREASEGYLAHLRGLASALEMLEGRVSVLVEYLKAVERGDSNARVDRATLRAAARLAKTLPAEGGGARFRAGHDADVADAMLVAHMGAVTKGMAEFEGFARRFSASHPEKSARAHRRGGF